MLRAVLTIASLALTVYALADCVQTVPERVQGIPKWAWIVLIVLVPWVGPITWLLVGRDREGGAAGGSRRATRPGPLAPDEDPEFLRRLDEQIQREKRERGEQGPEGPTAHG